MLDMYIYVLFIGTIVVYEELLIMHASFYSLGSTITPSYYNNKFQFLQLACRVISTCTTAILESISPHNLIVSGRFWGINRSRSQCFRNQPVPCWHLLVVFLLYWFEACSMDSSKRFGNFPRVLGPLSTWAKTRDHEIVRAEEKVVNGHPNTSPKSSSVVMDPQAYCEVICDWALNQRLYFNEFSFMQVFVHDKIE
jgi:hypothetical protein